MESWKGGEVESGKVERWKVERCTILYYTILYYTIVYYSILYYSISNIRIQQRLLANYVPGDTHKLLIPTSYTLAGFTVCNGRSACTRPGFPLAPPKSLRGHLE